MAVAMLIAGLAGLCEAVSAGEPLPAILPERVFEYLKPGTVLLNVNGAELTSDAFVDAVVGRLPASDRNALIQGAQIREELRQREMSVSDRETADAMDEFARAYGRGMPKGREVTADQLIAVLGIDRTLFKRYVARFVGLRKILLADGQIAADTGLDDDRFKQASDAYMKLLQMKYPARAATGEAYVTVGRTVITRAEAVEQYRSAVWSKAYQNAPAGDITARSVAGQQALNNDVIGVVDGIMKYQVVYARWNALGLIMTEEVQARVLQDIREALAARQGGVGQPAGFFEEFLRRKGVGLEEFKQGFEFQMTCMLSQMVEPQLTDAKLEQIFNSRPADFGKGDPLVRMIFVATQDDEGQNLPRVEPTGLSGVDGAYEKRRAVASAKARQTVRLAAQVAREKGFDAAAQEYNQEPGGGRIGRVPLNARDPRFTPALMKEIKRLSELPPASAGEGVEGADGWYLFQVEGIENPTFASVRRKVFVQVIGAERVKFQDELMHNAKVSGLLGPAYRAYLDAEWKAKQEAPAGDAPKNAGVKIKEAQP